MLQLMLTLAGIGQIGVGAASLGVPRALGWREQTSRLRPLTRQVFWTYASYICMTNLLMGLLSALAPAWLLDGTPLARAVCGYIAAYWGVRLVLQFTYYDRSDAPKGLIYELAHWGFSAAFGYFAGVYGWVAVMGS